MRVASQKWRVKNGFVFNVSTTTRMRNANTLANATASNPHAGLMLDTRVSTVVYQIRLCARRQNSHPRRTSLRPGLRSEI